MTTAQRGHSHRLDILDTLHTTPGDKHAIQTDTGLPRKSIELQLGHLARLGWIECTGHNSTPGRSVRVWGVTDSGLAQLSPQQAIRAHG